MITWRPLASYPVLTALTTPLPQHLRHLPELQAPSPSTRIPALCPQTTGTSALCPPDRQYLCTKIIGILILCCQAVGNSTSIPRAMVPLPSTYKLMVPMPSGPMMIIQPCLSKLVVPLLSVRKKVVPLPQMTDKPATVGTPALSPSSTSARYP